MGKNKRFKHNSIAHYPFIYRQPETRELNLEGCGHWLEDNVLKNILRVPLKPDSKLGVQLVETNEDVIHGSGHTINPGISLAMVIQVGGMQLGHGVTDISQHVLAHVGPKESIHSRRDSFSKLSTREGTQRVCAIVEGNVSPSRLLLFLLFGWGRGLVKGLLRLIDHELKRGHGCQLCLRSLGMRHHERNPLACSRKFHLRNRLLRTLGPRLEVRIDIHAL